MRTATGTRIGGTLAAAVLAAVAGGGSARGDELSEQARRCNELLSAAEVGTVCGARDVTVNAGARHPDDVLSFDRRADAMPAGTSEVWPQRQDIIRCSKRFQGAGGGELMVTVARVATSDQNLRWFDLAGRPLRGAANYTPLPGIGDAARQFSMGPPGGAGAIDTVEFVEGRWSVSIRTAHGELQGESYRPLCGFPAMQRLASAMAVRLDGGE